MPTTNTPVIHEPPPLPPQRRDRTSRSWFLGTLLGVLIATALLATLIWLATGLGLFHLLTSFRAGHAIMNVDQPTVVRQIQKLQRLETVSYTMDKIISGGSDNPYLPKFLVGDRLLLLVHGDVIAGVNLAKVQTGDVSVRGRDISIRLPPAEVFSTRIDN